MKISVWVIRRTKNSLLLSSVAYHVGHSSRARQISSMHRIFSNKCSQDRNHSRKSGDLQNYRMRIIAWGVKPKCSQISSKTRSIDQTMISREQSKNNRCWIGDQDNRELEVLGNLWTLRWPLPNLLLKTIACIMNHTRSSKTHFCSILFRVEVSLVTSEGSYIWKILKPWTRNKRHLLWWNKMTLLKKRLTKLFNS